MKNYVVINLKTEPALKKQAIETAKKLGVSLSAVLNNELRRLTVEQKVVFGSFVPATMDEDFDVKGGAPKKRATKEEKAILKLMERGVVKGAQLLKESGLSSKVYMQTVTFLELKGVIRSLGADTWAFVNR